MSTLNTVLHPSPTQIRQLIRGVRTLSTLCSASVGFLLFLRFKKAGQAGVHTRILKDLGRMALQFSARSAAVLLQRRSLIC